MYFNIDRKADSAAKKFLQTKNNQLSWLKAQGNRFLEALAVRTSQFDDYQQQAFEEEMVRLLPEYPACFVTYFIRNMIGEDHRAHRLGVDEYGFVFPHPSAAN